MTSDTQRETEIDRLRLAAFKTNSDEDKAAYYLAVSEWFQGRHYRTPPKVGSEELDAAGLATIRCALEPFAEQSRKFDEAAFVHFGTEPPLNDQIVAIRIPHGQLRACVRALAALAAPVDHPEVVGVKSAAEALDNVQSWVMQQRIELRPLDPDFHAKYDTLKAVGAKIRSEKAALQPSDSPALEAGVAVTDAMVERIKQRISVFREMRPEDDETWESWYFAAFDLLSVEVAALSIPAKEPK